MSAKHQAALFALFAVIASASAYYLPFRTVGSQHIAAIASNGIECANIGGDILKRKGSAVDAMIAVLLCEGVTGPQSMGIGGGFLATIYNREHGRIETLNAREAAPIEATEDMFVNKKITGGLAVAVPGEIKGYWELHQRYGVLPWADLFRPTIELCKRGIRVDKFLALILQEYEKQITESATLREIFYNEQEQRVPRFGEYYRRSQLAATFEIIAAEGVKSIYGGGVIGRQLVEDVQQLGGKLTEGDLKDYQAIWGEPIISKLTNDYTLFTIPIPGSGSILSYILNLAKEYFPVKSPIKMWHHIIETFKHGYGYRSQLTDNAFDPTILVEMSRINGRPHILDVRHNIMSDITSNNPEDYGSKFADEPKDHGTSNVVVMAENGDAISVTSTVNNVFGALVISKSTGIILNDEMDDFSTPGVPNSYGFQPSPSNYIRPHKRPVSSMTPSIILDKKGDVRLLIGAAGGSQITTSVALTIMRHLFLHEDLEKAIHAKRLHHQLLPMAVRYENGFSDTDEGRNILQRLSGKGHKLEKIPTLLGFGAVTGVSIHDNKVTPVFDCRRGGSTYVTGPRGMILNHRDMTSCEAV